MGGIIYDGTYPNGIVLSNPGTQGVILNLGTITNSNADAIYGQPTYAWTINNSGKIANSGTGGSGIDLKAGGSVNNNSSGSIAGYIDGIGIFGATGTVSNLGTITAAHERGIFLGAGGSVTNGASNSTAALISGVGGIRIERAQGTVSNFGTIAGAGSDTIYLAAGGSVTNSGLISGGSGIDILGAGTVTNFATIQASTGDGVYLSTGGSVTNGAAASIVGRYNGIEVAGIAGTVTNSGAIAGSAGFYPSLFVLVGAGVRLGAGGSVTNGAGGSVSGHYRGVEIVGAAGTVTNSGTITGSDGKHTVDGRYVGAGVLLSAGGSVTNNPGGTISGHYNGIELTGGATVSNFGTIAGSHRFGIYLGHGGAVVNADSGAAVGSIYGFDGGVFARGAVVTISNSGFIFTGGGAAIYTQAGGSVTNGESGVITGNTGISMPTAGGVVVNLGTIASFGFAVEMLSGSVTNGATNLIDATLSGGVSAETVDDFGIILGNVAASSVTVHRYAVVAGTQGIYINGPGPGTLISSGAISGSYGIAIKFNKYGGSLILDPSATEQGRIVGSLLGTETLELRNGSTAGTVRDVAQFDQITVDPGATWTVGIEDTGAGHVITGNGDAAPLAFEVGGTIDLSGVSGFATIDLSEFGPNTASLVNGNFAGLSGPVISAKGGDFGNTLDASALTGANRVVLNGGMRSDTLTGGAGNDTLNGNGGNDTLNGGGGNDWLNGGVGSDTMIGGTGNDTYVVDNAGDVVSEAAGQGTDTVKTNLTNYTLGANVENLTYIGSGNFAGTGNSLNNVITGGAGNDTLNGGGGNDTLNGGGGNDWLNGGAGADTMIGGAGNDAYVVDNAGDVVSEAAGQGTDTVKTNLTNYTLGANVENLTYIGSGNFTGTGNSLNNVITGGAGNDTLNGGGGNDSFLFNTTLGASNVDTIFNFTHLADKILLSRSVFTAFGATGPLASTAFVDVHTAAETTSSRIVYDSSTGVLKYDPDGAGGTAATQFATLSPHPILSSADFTIV